jgi:hypothetical protein
VRENALIPQLCFTRFSLPFFLLLKSFQVRGCRLKAASQPPTLGITTMSILSKIRPIRTGFYTQFSNKISLFNIIPTQRFDFAIRSYSILSPSARSNFCLTFLVYFKSSVPHCFRYLFRLFLADKQANYCSLFYILILIFT